jgi:hypothetical protein
MELYTIGALVTLGFLVNADKKGELKWHKLLFILILWPLMLGSALCSLYTEWAERGPRQ